MLLAPSNKEMLGWTLYGNQRLMTKCNASPSNHLSHRGAASTSKFFNMLQFEARLYCIVLRAEKRYMKSASSSRYGFTRAALNLSLKPGT